MKGQTALEMMFVVAIVITVASIVFVAYSQEANDTVAETTIRTQMDLRISQARVFNTTCADATLRSITMTQNGATFAYDIDVEPNECIPLLNYYVPDVLGRVTEALGCRYTPGESLNCLDCEAVCNGKHYNIQLT